MASDFTGYYQYQVRNFMYNFSNKPTSQNSAALANMTAYDYRKVNMSSLENAVKCSAPAYYQARGSRSTPLGGARGRKGSL